MTVTEGVPAVRLSNVAATFLVAFSANCKGPERNLVLQLPEERKALGGSDEANGAARS